MLQIIIPPIITACLYNIVVINSESVPTELSAQLFPDHDAAFNALQTWAKDHNFAASRGRFKTDKTEAKTIRKRWVVCTKSGIFQSTSTGIRQTKSRKEECQWEATLTRLQGSSSWQIAGKLACSC